MNLLEQYGIKEVADVTIFEIVSEGVFKPYLFLDTLKISTLEQTAEQTEARGGKGNAPLLIWDFGKEINVTLQDALYSPRSMGLMWGGEGNQWSDSSSATLTKYLRYVPNIEVTTAVGAPIIDDINNTWTIVSAYDDNMSAVTTLTAGKAYTCQVSATVTKRTLQITAQSFPGTYKIVGDTYSRNRATGKDEYFQFVIHQAKLSSENTITLEAEGDPTTFDLNARVLRPANGVQMELIQYTI